MESKIIVVFSINEFPVKPISLKGNGFLVSLSYLKQKISTYVGKDVGKERKERIKDQIRENNKISARQLSNLFGVTEKTIERDLTALKNSGKIRRIGGRKTGWWEVIEDKQ